MDTKEASRQLNLLIDERTYDNLRSLSVLEDRSMSAQVRYLIRKEYDSRQTTDKPPITYAAE